MLRKKSLENSKFFSGNGRFSCENGKILQNIDCF